MAQRYVWESGPLKLIPTPAYLTRGEEHDQFTRIATMMAEVHNAFIRAFNCNWHLAPKIPKADLPDFVAYLDALCRSLHGHHEEEEMYVFPQIEEVTGQVGLMSQNVKQHEAFHDGLEAFTKYLSDLLANDPTQFSASTFRSKMEAFASPLQHHLEAEVTTLIELRKYADIPGFDLMKLSENAAKRTMEPIKMVTSLPAILLNHDRTYEDSYSNALWPHGIPLAVSFFVRKVGTYWHPRWWKFTTCDGNQMPRAPPYMDLEDVNL